MQLDPPDVDAEYSASVLQVNYHDIQCVAALAGRRQALTAYGSGHLLGMQNIKIEKGVWRTDPWGDRAIIVADIKWKYRPCPGLTDLPEKEIFLGAWYPTPCDLIAFKPGAPRAFWPLSGSAWMLGYDNLEEANFFERPLTVHETPLDWLRDGCEGIVMLNWKYYIPTIFHGVPKLRFNDLDWARRAKAMFERPMPVPEIEIKVDA